MHDALLTTARRLLGTSDDPPTETDLRRSVSTAYYALFHALCRLVVDLAFAELKPSDPAWTKAYRALDHGVTKRRCEAGRLRGKAFPDRILRIGHTFCKLQDARHSADYDPHSEMTMEAATMQVDAAGDALQWLASLDATARHGFAAYLEQPPRK